MLNIKIKIYFFLFLFLFCLIYSKNALAVDHYVRDGATGSNNGSDWTNAYPKLPPTLQRGHTYYIADGTYGAYVFDDDESGTQYIYIKKAIDKIRCSQMNLTPAQCHGSASDWEDIFGNGQAEFYAEPPAPNAVIVEFTRGYYVFDGMTGSGGLENVGSYGFKIHPSNCARENILVGIPKYVLSYPISHVKFSHTALVSCPFIRGKCVNTGSHTGDSCYYKADCWYCADETRHCGVIDANVRYCTDCSGNDLADCEGDSIYGNVGLYSVSINYGANNLEISNNLLARGTSNMNIIKVTDSIIENNFFDSNWGAGQNEHGDDQHDQQISTYRTNNIILRGNIFKDTAYAVAGVKRKVTEVEPNSNWNVYNNIVYGHAYQPAVYTGEMKKKDIMGVFIIADSREDVLTSWKIHHNTVANVDLGGSGFFNVQQLTDIEKMKSYVYNNMFYNVSGNIRICASLNCPVAAAVSGYNAYYNCVPPEFVRDEAVTADVRNNINPFVDVNNKDFRLNQHTVAGKNDLPLIFKLDKDGNSRTNWDRGAYEYTGATTPDTVPPSAPSGLMVK